MAILFLVGKGHEKPEIINDLFDFTKYSSRPAYNIANDHPLILYDCYY